MRREFCVRLEKELNNALVSAECSDMPQHRGLTPLTSASKSIGPLDRKIMETNCKGRIILKRELLDTPFPHELATFS